MTTAVATPTTTPTRVPRPRRPAQMALDARMEAIFAPGRASRAASRTPRHRAGEQEQQQQQQQQQPRLGPARRTRTPVGAAISTDELQRLLLAATEQTDGLSWLIAHATSVALLTAEEEQALARTLHDTRATAVARTAARDRLITANLRLVMRMARNLMALAGSLELNDLIQEGVIGLMRAVERYDPARGARFSTYATWWIAQAIHRAAADRGHAIRLPVYLYERRRRLLRERTRLLEELAREPTLDELCAAYALHPVITGSSTDQQPIVPSEVALLLAVHAPAPSLDAPLHSEYGGGHHNSTPPGHERALGSLVADPASLDAYDAAEGDANARALLTRARGVLTRRQYEIFTLHALGQYTLDDLARAYDVSRERIRQIDNAARELMRAALSGETSEATQERTRMRAEAQVCAQARSHASKLAAAATAPVRVEAV